MSRTKQCEAPTDRQILAAAIEALEITYIGLPGTPSRWPEWAQTNHAAVQRLRELRRQNRPLSEWTGSVFEKPRRRRSEPSPA